MMREIDPLTALAMYLEGQQFTRVAEGLPRLLMLDELLDTLQKEYLRMSAFIVRRAEEAFQFAVVDPEMWEMESAADGTGTSMQDYKDDWIEQWLEGND